LCHIFGLDPQFRCDRKWRRDGAGCVFHGSEVQSVETLKRTATSSAVVWGSFDEGCLAMEITSVLVNEGDLKSV
jgi:hypothetical protein